MPLADHAGPLLNDVFLILSLYCKTLLYLFQLSSSLYVGFHTDPISNTARSHHCIHIAQHGKQEVSVLLLQNMLI